MSSSAMSRRTLLRSIAVGGAAIAAPSLLTACSSDSAGGGSVSNAGKKAAAWPAYTPAKGATPDLAPTAEGVQAGYTKYPADLVKAIAEKPGSGKEKIKVLSITYGTPPKPAAQNKYWAAVNKALGVDVEFTVVPDADFRSKMATLFAGDDIPDVINIGGGYVLPREAQFVKSRCADLTEYLSGDAIKDYPNLAGIPQYAWEGMGRISGRIYGVPVERPKPQDTLFFNSGAFTKAGYKAGMSADDFAAMSKDATAGKKWALGASATAFFGYKTHANWFGAPNEFAMQDGKAVHWGGTDEFRATLEYLAKVRKQGSYYPEATSVSQVDLKTQFWNGSVLSMTDGFLAYPAAAQGIKDAFDLDALVPYAVDGGTAKYQQSRGIFGYTVLKKASKARIELILRVLDYLAAPFGTEEYELTHFGLEGTHFERDKDNNPIPTELGLLESKTNVPFTYLSDAPQVLYVPGFPSVVERLHAWQQKVVPLMQPNIRFGLQSDTYNRQGAALQQLIDDGVTAIVSGRKKVSDWDAVYAKWQAQGGKKVVEEFTAEYAAAH
ncbi:sugar ABC transporter substrate-binding protein [Streptomyces longispororuber]|uniref:sugar ABC transporter substrate-binding protein n=1 Tax=Streptomyces longispororuber TaxID=68230 RepID=UPI002109DDE4|nr:sugar ABC transporter substrate-binding protein [Streptomyces longispororuber]MCQ4212620.1 sugar ABC transporter substrate-binding protein [Streptomyces longispororuber]